MLQLPPDDCIVVAVDEAGRGCLAFEVCAAAVVLPAKLPDDPEELKMLGLINDSKKVTALRREKLASFIKEYAIAYGIGIATPEEIDSINILQATYLAMHRAIKEVVNKMGGRVDKIIVDGDRFKPYLISDQNSDEIVIPHTCCTEGDATHMNIAAASILAKTHRDKLVLQHVSEHPEWKEMYGFDKNKAYGTLKHMDGLKKYGVTGHHRKSFGPVRRYA